MVDDYFVGKIEVRITSILGEMGGKKNHLTKMQQFRISPLRIILLQCSHRVGDIVDPIPQSIEMRKILAVGSRPINEEDTRDIGARTRMSL